MNCTEAYDAILEADTAVLRGEGTGELAQHLGECAACRQSARAVVAAMGALDRALEDAAGTARPRQRRRARPRVTWRIVPWALVAAAAAAVILVPKAGVPRRPRAADPEPSAVAVDVDVSASPRPVAVLRTDDPNITVVWFF